MRKLLLINLWLALLLTACTSAAAPAVVAPTPPPAATQPPTLIPTVDAPPSPTRTVAPAPSATSPPPSATPTTAPTPTFTPPAGQLIMPRGALTGRPYAVMLDNHPAAYPQTGLDHAVLVFEALAEFGITRYMAIYVPGISPELQTIGPVRSARPYFVEWAKGLRAIYTHAGGSPEGLLLAETAIEIVNMDALRRDAEQSFRRSAERAAPHNLYTSSAQMGAFAVQKAVDEPDLSEVGFLYEEEAPRAARPASQALRYFFIYREQSVGWVYDPQSNDYGYLRGSRPHIDARSGAQLRFKNLIMMEVPEAPIPGDPKGRIEQQVIGEGPARLFFDGRQQEIRWRKEAGFAQLRFYLPSGEEIRLRPGPTWIAAIPSLDNLTVEGGN